jgi:hypothetical protein
MKIANAHAKIVKKSFNVVKNLACTFILLQMNIFFEATQQTCYTGNISAPNINNGNSCTG